MPPVIRTDIMLFRKAIRSGAKPLVARMLAKLGPDETAQLLSDLPPAELKFVIDLLIADRDRLAQTLGAIPDDLIADFSKHLGPAAFARALAVLDPDDAKHFVQLLPDDTQSQVLAHSTPAKRQQIERLLRYDPESAAGRMTPQFASVGPDATVGQAIRHIRELTADVPLFYLYVVEDTDRLLGVVSLRQLVRSNDDAKVSKLMETDLVSVEPESDQAHVARIVSRRNLLAVPVVEKGHILGMVTVDDVLDVLDREATEDMYNMAGLSEGDRVFSPPHRSLFKRLPWNALNLLTSILAASVVAQFEGTISKLVVLATFMPMVAGIGGNTGNQTLTVIIRAISLGELDFSSGFRAVLKELVVGMSIGLILGTVVAVLAFLWRGSIMLGAVIALAIIANLVIAALVGTTIPLTLRRLRLDPALGGSILVTMCTDVFGFLVFLGLATVFMKYLV